MTLTMKLAGVVTGLSLALSVAGQAHATDLTFYYPVAVGGPVTKVIDGMAADFEKANPDIHIKPVYAGSYQDTIAKTLRSEEHTSELQSLMRISYAVFCLKKKKKTKQDTRSK